MKSQWIPYVGVALFDPVHSNRHLTRNALFALGFRDITMPATLEDFRKSFETQSFDVCILDVTEHLEPACRLIEAVRAGHAGGNPFVVFLATSWTQSGSLVKRVIDSGADDLILRPLSTGLLRARISLQVSARKDFVVTSSYIGPDRRRDASRPSLSPLIQVPNTLRAKAAEGLLSGGDPQIIAESRALLQRRRLQQGALRIGIGARLISEGLAGGDGATAQDGEVQQIEASAQDLQLHAKAPEFGALAPLADEILAAVGQLRSALRDASPRPVAAKPLERLSELCLSVRQALDAQCDLEAVTAEISETVARIQARRAAMDMPPARRAEG